MGKKKGRLDKEDEFDIENVLEINTSLCFKYVRVLPYQMMTFHIL